MTGGVPVKVTEPFRFAVGVIGTDRSGPALALGAPEERGPSVGPVVWITSKFVMPMLEMWLKALAGQRLSGVIEMEKKPPLSATNAPYFFKPRSNAFSSAAQLFEMTKLA